jgi:acetylornithine/N-succinyldiaminopimelate aminotransferase
MATLQPNPSPAAPAPTTSSPSESSSARTSTDGATKSAASTADLLAKAKRHLLGNYRPAEVVFVRGEGSELVDSEGRRYLDFAAGVAVNALGHAHPELTRTIQEQSARLMHVSNYFYNEENILLASELCARTGFDRAFFCNSGAEANEAMFKLARRHAYARGHKEKLRFLAFDNSFHGRTFATVNLTGTPSYREGFGPFEGVSHVRYGDLDAARAAMGDDVCAIVVEPVQGEGGVLPAPPGFIEGLRELADRSGALLLADEVQTGIGRTGRLLGIEHSGVRADAVSLAKGLGGGFPIGAMLVREALAGSLPPGTHGSTFGGNPLASSAARAVLRTLDAENLVEGAERKGRWLAARLAEVAAEHTDLVESERGAGLLRGLVLVPSVDARAALAKVREHGVLVTIAGGRVLRFTPPLVVTEAELTEGVRRVSDALRALRVEITTPS